MNNFEINSVINRLQRLCDVVPALLYAIDDESFQKRPLPDKWSKKEIIGHLIDSATNNHHRFVRGQFENTPLIVYNQNAWNRANCYKNIDGRQLIAFWESYNRYLLLLINAMPEETFTKTVDTGGTAPYTISFLITDYVDHLEHHLKQIIDITSLS